MNASFLALAVLLASCRVAVAEAPAKQPDEERVVRYHEGKVTVRARRLMPGDFLTEIARQSGAKVSGAVQKPVALDADWTDVPLEEALQHVLRDQNFALVYAENGALRAIQLKGLRREGPAPPPASPGGQSSPSPEDALYKAFAAGDEVPIDGAVAKRLGRTESPWDLLANTAIGDEDAGVRRSAVENGMRALETNEELRRAVASTAASMSDAQLAAWARGVMYHRAEDFVRNVRRSTTLPDFRARSGAVLRELRKIPFTGPVPVEGSRAKHAE